MKKWIKDGCFYRDKIELNGFWVFNPTEEQLKAAGYVEFVPSEPTVEQVKADKIKEITEYDSSTEINEFFIDDSSLWLDKNTRSGLMLRFNAEKASGITVTTLWYGTQSFTLPIDTAINMLYAIELYASNCYDNTAQHKANVEALETKEEITAYNYKTGYPEKLHFTSNA